MTKKKLIAKTRVGKEYMYSKSHAYFVKPAEALRICEALNRAEYELGPGECWHVYEYDYVQETYVEFEIVIKRGKLLARAI